MPSANTAIVSYTSELENDKLINDALTSSFPVSASSSVGLAGNIATASRTHTFGANVLPVMIWSIDDTAYQDAGSMIYTEGATNDPMASATCYSTSTTLVVVASNYTAGSLTFYYKMVLIADT